MKPDIPVAGRMDPGSIDLVALEKSSFVGPLRHFPLVSGGRRPFLRIAN